MKKRILFFIGAGTAAGLCAAELPAGVKPLGKMDGFYRYTAVLGPMLETGHQVMEIPDWMTGTDFPYQKRPYEKEIPFADGLSVVRLLGAGKTAEEANKPGGTADLVYRDASGKLQYRRDALKARLDPYLDLGYTDLTLVMDNIPWCFPEKPVQKEYGQIGAPADYHEWYVFMKALCAELKRLYGEDAVKHFRFRMGTEMQDERRWTGGYEGYLQYYDLAAKAVKEEIPEAGFGPFNRSNPVAPKDQPRANAETVSIIELAKHCAGNGVPFDFLSRSFYYFSSQPKPGVFNNIQPDQRLPEMAELWEQAEQILGPVPREVHELGPHLSTEEGLYGLDTGARGAAQAFDTVTGFREIGVSRLWHWQLFEKIGEDKQLFYSMGWLYSVFDHMRGGDLFVLPVQAADDHGNLHKALISVLPDRAILVVSCWNADRTRHVPDTLTVRIPAAGLPRAAASVQQLSFTEENSIYDVLRCDLAAAGLLSEKHKKHRGAPATTAVTGGYDSMSADKNAGARFIAGNWEKYEQLMRDALKLSAFSGSCAQSAAGLDISFTAESPSVTVLVLNFKEKKTGER